MRLGSKTRATPAPTVSRRERLTPTAFPRERVAAGLRCLILLTVFVMARSQAGVASRGFDLVVSVGAAYVLVSTFFPWRRYDARRATLIMLAADIGLITALIYSQAGIYSEYYLLYYLPILHASVRLNFRDAVGTCLLSALSYLLIGALEGPEARVTISAISRVLTFTVSASLLAGFFLLLAREQRAFQQLSRSYEAALQAKAEFLSHVSHEFRTPLTAIVGFSQLLYEHEDQLDAPRRQEYLTIVREQSQHLARMIEDMLDLSRIDEGRLVLRRSAVNLPEAVAAAVALLDTPGVAQRVQVVGEDIARAAWADPDETAQVLARLLHVAVWLSEEGAPVEVEVTAISRATLRVAVRATRVAAGEEAVTGVMRALAGEAGPRGAPEAGLGLAASRALVELHGGRVWGEEADGGAVALCFTLPFCRPGEMGPEVIVGAEADGEDSDRGRRSARAPAHAGHPGSVG